MRYLPRYQRLIMAKKIGYIFSLLLILPFSIEAKSLLYKVSSQSSTVYVLGSIHLAKPELYPLDKEIINAYEKSDILVVEVDPESEESARQMQNSIDSFGIYPPGQSLKSELSQKTYGALESYVNKTGTSLETMQRMRPWIVMLQLTISEMMKLGYSSDLGIDNHFLNRAKSDKKRIVGLETAQEQMALLSRDDKRFQDRLLLYTLKSMQELEPMLDKMFESWQKGEEKIFEEIISMPLEEEPDLKEIYADLITKRNYKMVQKIEGFLKRNKNYFVIVGSGHLVGKEGILELLRSHSYRVTQE